MITKPGNLKSEKVCTIVAKAAVLSAFLASFVGSGYVFILAYAYIEKR